MYLSEIQSLERRYLAKTLERVAVDIESGEGATVQDGEGRKYIDFTAGCGHNSLGYSHKGWLRETTAQLQKVAETSTLFYSRPRAQLAKMLCERTDMAEVVFTDSPNEANYLALSFVQQYKAGKILVIEDPDLPTSHVLYNECGVVRIFHNDLEGLDKIEGASFGALFIPCIVAGNRVGHTNEEFMERLVAFGKKHDLLFIVNESNTGLGRTGRFLGSSFYRIEPDIVLLSRGLAGGLPLAAVLISARVKDKLKAEQFREIVGGNTAAIAGAKVVLQSIDGKLLDTIANKGSYLAGEIEKMEGVNKVTGSGLLLGIYLAEGYSVLEVQALAAKNGLLVRVVGSSLLVTPSLLISQRELDDGLERLQKTLVQYKEIVFQREQEPKKGIDD